MSFIIDIQKSKHKAILILTHYYTTTNASVAAGLYLSNTEAIYWMDMCISFFAPLTVILCGNFTILYVLLREKIQNLTRSVDPTTHPITVMLTL